MSRKRDANFTKEETDKLMELVEHYLDTILNNRCSLVIHKQKENVWNIIAEEYNSFTTNHRTAKQLKHKLENMKKKSELRELQQQLREGKRGSQENGEDENTKWLRRIKEEKDKCNTWDDAEDNISNDSMPQPSKKPKIQTVYVKPMSKDTIVEKSRVEECESQNYTTSVYTAEQTSKLFQLEYKQKQERHRLQLEYDKKSQDALLHKLALEARLYEAQLNKINLEVKLLNQRIEGIEEG